jgi:Tol biopolymer transport system component
VISKYDGGGSQLYEVAPDGTGLQPCSIFQPGDTDPAWTHDGSKVAVVRGGEIVVMNSQGSNQERIKSRGAIQLAFSPDGEKLAYSSWRENTNCGFEIFVVNLSDHSKTRLVANPIIRDKEVDSRALSWSPVL